MTTVRTWTGLEARALRRALRMRVRAFAQHLGVAPRTVAKWENLGVAVRPRPDTQAILDTALARADGRLICGSRPSCGNSAGTPVALPGALVSKPGQGTTRRGPMTWTVPSPPSAVRASSSPPPC